MRIQGREFGDNYTVRHLLPEQAIALRERANARTVAMGVAREVSARHQGDEKLLKAIKEPSRSEDVGVAERRARIFTPIKKR